MARRKENEKGKSVNRVRRKADEQDITLGSKSKLPEDDRKSIRKKGDNLEIKSPKKPTSRKPDEAKKGRAPKQSKSTTKEPRQKVTRKSELEKQYTKEMRNLRNRLKYREKQGFFIKWETLPQRKTGGITTSDIDYLKSYQVRLDADRNEIFLERTKYKEDARKLLIPKDLLPSNTFIQNEPDFELPKNDFGNYDVLDTIESYLYGALERYYYDLESVDEVVNADFYVELMYAKIELIQECIKIFNAQITKYSDVLLARYYHNHENEIASCLTAINQTHYVEEVEEVGNELLRYIEVH